MMSRRTIRIVAVLLALLIVGATTIFGYDVFLGQNITETFFEPQIE